MLTTNKTRMLRAEFEKTKNARILLEILAIKPDFFGNAIVKIAGK